MDRIRDSRLGHTTTSSDECRWYFQLHTPCPVPIEAKSLNSFKSNPKTTSQDNQYETTARICSLTHISCGGMLLPMKACPFAWQDECKPCVSWCFLKSSSIVSDKYSTPLIISSHHSILLSLTIARLKIEYQRMRLTDMKVRSRSESLNWN